LPSRPHVLRLGDFVILEFIEERPLFVALPGMASRINLYHQVRHSPPVSPPP
jgi:hypothetical protein